MVGQRRNLDDRRLFRRSDDHSRRIGGGVRRIEPRGGCLGGVDDNERIAGEGRRCSVGDQQSFEPGVVFAARS
jgi:hypothetical protein